MKDSSARASIGVEKLSELGLYSAAELQTRLNQTSLDVNPKLKAIFPNGLVGGSIVCVDSAALVFLLLSTPTQNGSWAAIIGNPNIGIAAADEIGVCLKRCVLIREKNNLSSSHIASLIDVFNILVLSKNDLTEKEIKLLISRARNRNCVLIITTQNDRWKASNSTSLSVKSVSWIQVANGKGRIKGRWINVIATKKDLPKAHSVWIGEEETLMEVNHEILNSSLY